MSIEAILDEVEAAHALDGGFLAQRTISDGRVIGVTPLLNGAAMLSIGRPEELADQWGGRDDQWTYSSQGQALAAFATWQPLSQPEPTGWTRHPGSGRVRPSGDPTREYVSG